LEFPPFLFLLGRILCGGGQGSRVREGWVANAFEGTCPGFSPASASPVTPFSADDQRMNEIKSTLSTHIQSLNLLILGSHPGIFFILPTRTEKGEHKTRRNSSLATLGHPFIPLPSSKRMNQSRDLIKHLIDS